MTLLSDLAEFQTISRISGEKEQALIDHRSQTEPSGKAHVRQGQVAGFRGICIL
jgi:hypothetical protein